MNEERKLSPLEQARLDRQASIPQPSVPVLCPRCKSSNKKLLSTKRGKDFYWRYYCCVFAKARGDELGCNKNYWCGVRYSDGLTVFTTNTPHMERVGTFAMMTGNLRNILPPGHPAVTADYNQFLPNGKLPKETLHSNMDAEEAPRNVLMAKFDAEASNVEVTTSSDYDDPIAREFNAFKEWLAANIDSLKAAGYTDNLEQMVYNRWIKTNGTTEENQ